MFQEFPSKELRRYPKELSALLDEHRQDIDKLLKAEPGSYSDLLPQMQDMDEELGMFFAPLSHINSVMNTEASQKAYEECIPLLSAYESEMSHNEKLYKTLKNISADDSDQARVLELMLRDFRLSGADLPEDQQKRLEKIDLRLSELGTLFSRNLLESTNAHEMIIDDPADVAELPASDLENAAFKESGKTLYRFTLQMPSYISYMTYGSNRERREDLYRAYTTRAKENEKVIDEILLLRDEKARLLGFDNYAEYALQTRDAGSVKEVLDFLDKLTNAALPQARKELEELRKFAHESDGIELQAYDISYYSEKLKKIKYGYDDAMTKPYFEQNKVLSGMLDIVSKLFGVIFEKVNVPVWDKTVKVYDIYENSRLSGRIYFDLEARKEKRGGAWMNDWETRFVDSAGKTHLPSAFVVANFSPATAETPSLLRHDEIVTLFHEMGHAIHHLFSKQKERSISGINGVAWDVVEFPSQFLENFAYEAAILRRFGYHYQTSEPIPEELLVKIKKSKNFHSAMGILRQVEFAMFDLMLHQKLYQGTEVQDLLDNIRKKTSLLKPPAYNRFQHGFAHIFAGGYAAGYYSYKWAEVFSAEAFFECLDQQNGLNPNKAQGYKKHILSNGALRPMSQLFVEWLGRKPAVSSLSRLYDIVKESA